MAETRATQAVSASATLIPGARARKAALSLADEAELMVMEIEHFLSDKADPPTYFDPSKAYQETPTDTWIHWRCAAIEQLHAQVKEILRGEDPSGKFEGADYFSKDLETDGTLYALYVRRRRKDFPVLLVKHINALREVVRLLWPALTRQPRGRALGPNLFPRAHSKHSAVTAGKQTTPRVLTRGVVL